MNARTSPRSWLLVTAVVGMIVLALLLLSATGPLTGRAAEQPNSPADITIQQKAAILGPQLLLTSRDPYQHIYLPYTRK